MELDVGDTARCPNCERNFSFAGKSACPYCKKPFEFTKVGLTPYQRVINRICDALDLSRYYKDKS